MEPDVKCLYLNYFYNNIFYADGTARYSYATKHGRNKDGTYRHKSGLAESTNNVFSNNVFYGNHVNPPKDSHAITADPMLVKPGSGKNGFDSLEGYKLKPGSPCIATGLPVPDSGGRDFWGNILSKNKKPNIGVDNK